MQGGMRLRYRRMMSGPCKGMCCWPDIAGSRWSPCVRYAAATREAPYYDNCGGSIPRNPSRAVIRKITLFLCSRTTYKLTWIRKDPGKKDIKRRTRNADAREGIRTPELLREWTLNPSPLTSRQPSLHNYVTGLSGLNHCHLTLRYFCAPVSRCITARNEKKSQ